MRRAIIDAPDRFAAGHGISCQQRVFPFRLVSTAWPGLFTIHHPRTDNQAGGAISSRHLRHVCSYQDAQTDSQARHTAKGRLRKRAVSQKLPPRYPAALQPCSPDFTDPCRNMRTETLNPAFTEFHVSPSLCLSNTRQLVPCCLTRTPQPPKLYSHHVAVAAAASWQDVAAHNEAATATAGTVFSRPTSLAA